MHSTVGLVLAVILGLSVSSVPTAAVEVAVAVGVDETAHMPYDWRERNWVYPTIADDEAMYVASPHPAAPKTHVEPAYEVPPNAGLSADEIEHRRLWAVKQPSDGTPFIPVYHKVKPTAPDAIRIPPPRDRPTVLPPFNKPERVVGSRMYQPLALPLCRRSDPVMYANP